MENVLGRILDNRKKSLEKNESKSHAVQQDGVDAKMGGDLSVNEQKIYGVAPTEISNVARKWHHERGINGLPSLREKYPKGHSEAAVLRKAGRWHRRRI